MNIGHSPILSKLVLAGPAGLELSYRFNSDWNVGFGSSRRTERFLIEDDDTVVETNEWVSYLRGGWQTTPALTVNLYAGYYFDGELEVTDQAALEWIAKAQRPGYRIQILTLMSVVCPAWPL